MKIKKEDDVSDAGDLSTVTTEAQLDIRVIAGGYIVTTRALKGKTRYCGETTTEQIFVQPRKLVKYVADFLETHKNVVEG